MVMLLMPSLICLQVEMKDLQGLHMAMLVDLAFLLHGHGKPASIFCLPPLVLGIFELGFFIGLGF